ncbi:MAG: AAA-associated domain-containing protein, partial [Gammaproteobacteria bacterium]|nr:AAA-associated domain-containing protein [Gammaproteobacteria bacterium]
DNLFTAVEALEMLGFARVRRGKIFLTNEGFQFAEADILNRKKIFSTQLLTYIELARHIRSELDHNNDHEIDKSILIQKLDEHFSEEISNEIFRVIVDWGRYAEIFAYNDRTEQLSLEDPK